MKLSLIHDALTHYYQSGYPLVPKDYTINDVLVAIEECARQSEVLHDEVTLGATMHLITNWSLVNLLSMATYDICGEIIKSNPHHGFDRLLDFYTNTLRYEHELDLTRSAIACGFDFIKDLWAVNEDTDCNNPNGTLKTFEHDEITKLRYINHKQMCKLKEVLKYVEAYYITNKDFLNFEDDVVLPCLIDDIKHLIKEGGESNE